MNISQIDIFRFSIRMESFTIATGTMHFAQNMLVRVHTANGLYGMGECSAFPMIVGENQETCLAMAREFAKIWKNKDALDIPARMQELHSYAARNATAKSAFDMALYDLSAKAAGLPLYKFLGGDKRVVETDITVGINTPLQMAKEATEFVKKGARIIKVKLGKGVKEDIERISSVRSAVGNDTVLRIDANQGWTFEEASHILNTIAETRIEFCEQPMRTSHDDQLPELRRQSPIKIMADESCYDHHDARKQISTASCDYINIKLAKSGGILEALNIHRVAALGGIECMIGGMLESRLAVTANLHFAYACLGITFFDLDAALLGHLEDPVIDGMQYKGFFPETNDLPGIGADVEEAFLHNCEKWTI
ncbi:MAG: dipeptide epimerase [Chitinophagaceae bacterium]|nr:dipeptide epimerase [Chitinophagaceae bacterium]